MINLFRNSIHVLFVICFLNADTNPFKYINQDILDNMKTNIPLNRLGASEDIANLVCYLSSDLSSYITGQTINVDGGFSIKND